MKTDTYTMISLFHTQKAYGWRVIRTCKVRNQRTGTEREMSYGKVMKLKRLGLLRIDESLLNGMSNEEIKAIGLKDANC